MMIGILYFKETINIFFFLKDSEQNVSDIKYYNTKLPLFGSFSSLLEKLLTGEKKMASLVQSTCDFRFTR